MAVNLDKPWLWNADTRQSVDYYNEWFLSYAPMAFRETRVKTVAVVEEVFAFTDNLRSLTVDVLRHQPHALEVLRMATAPPIARDRLIGLAKVSKSLVENMEKHHRVSPKMDAAQVQEELLRIIITITRLIDRDIVPWLDADNEPTALDIDRATTVIADRLGAMLTNPVIRNAQEERQLARLSTWLEDRGYALSEVRDIRQLLSGTYAHRVTVQGLQAGNESINIPIDAVIMPMSSGVGTLPILVEAKSAGDFTNTNKRRKEEASKVRQLRNAYGSELRFILLLGGYFDSGYLGYEAAEGIDWIWEHRMDDLIKLGL